MKLKILALVTLLNSFYLQTMAIELDDNLIEDIDTTNDLPYYHILYGKQKLKPYMEFSIKELSNKAINEQDQNARELLIRKRIYDCIPERIRKTIPWQDLITTANVKELSDQEIFIIITEFHRRLWLPNLRKEVKERATQKGPEALYNLGYLYYKDYENYTDIDKAKKYYKEAANQGHVHAQHQYAWLSDFSIYPGASENFSIYQELAEQGYASSQYRCGQKSERNKDYQQALRYYRGAAAQGHINAQAAVERIANNYPEKNK